MSTLIRSLSWSAPMALMFACIFLYRQHTTAAEVPDDEINRIYQPYTLDLVMTKGKLPTDLQNDPSLLHVGLLPNQEYATALMDNQGIQITPYQPAIVTGFYFTATLKGNSLHYTLSHTVAQPTSTAGHPLPGFKTTYTQGILIAKAPPPHLQIDGDLTLDGDSFHLSTTQTATP